MGKIELKKRKFTKQDIDKLKNDAIEEESLQLELECKDIFEDDYAGVVLKLIDLDIAIEDDKNLQAYIILNRHDLYEVILDNPIEDIVTYFMEKIKDARI